ncbi:porin, partial [Parabacteroides distasonis]
MKRLTVAWLSAFLLSGSALTSYAQTNSPIPERDSSSVSLFEYATKIPKQNKVFNLDLEMHAGFNADFFSGKLDEAAFRFRDVKIDVTGEVNDRLFYWYRQTLNGGYEGQALENLNESIEYAYIGYKLNERFTLTAGKQDVFYGGFEYDENPLLIYEYSDMNEYSLCYLTGIGLGYQPNESQEIRLQVTNSRMGSMEDEYGRLPEGFKKPRVPLFYTLNWNGNFLDELIHLRYSVSAAEQAQGKYMYSVFTGQSIEAGPVYAYF